MKPVAETTRMRTPRTTTGQRRRLTHSLSGFEASHIPDAVMGMEQSNASKLSIAVKLFANAIKFSLFVLEDSSFLWKENEIMRVRGVSLFFLL